MGTVLQYAYRVEVLGVEIIQQHGLTTLFQILDGEQGRPQKPGLTRHDQALVLRPPVLGMPCTVAERIRAFGASDCSGCILSTESASA